MFLGFQTMIKMKCPNPACGKAAAVKDEFAGKRAKCPACGTIMNIPDAPEVAPPASAVRAPASRAPAPPPRPAPPPGEEEYEDYEREPRARVTKSGQVTAIAIVNFVLGGLSVLGGLCVSLSGVLFGGLSSAAKGTQVQVQGMNPQQAEKFARDMAKLQSQVGGSFAWLATVLVVMGVVILVWGAAAITDGVGVLKRRSWGRLLALVLAGVSAVLALIYLVLAFMGGGAMAFINAALFVGYAVWVFIVMTKPSVVREFS